MWPHIAIISTIRGLEKCSSNRGQIAAKHNGLTLEKALGIFYHSHLYRLMSEGVSDMHCMSDEYLVQELEEEQKTGL